jgi:hypothetical protein
MSASRWLIFSIFLILTATLLAAVLTPSLRLRVQQYLIHPGRDVLATAEGDLLNDGGLAKVIKFRTEEGIFIEVIKHDANGGMSAVDRILLPDKHDGLFNFQGHITRLAIADVDNDGQMELLAPTFDNQLVPHLNVFRYNPAIKRFEPFQPAAESLKQNK